MTVVDPGTRLSRVVATSEGAAVAIYSHGRFRDGRVVKVTPTRALVEFEASADGRVKRLYRHVSGQMRHWSEYLYVVDRAGPLVVLSGRRAAIRTPLVGVPMIDPADPHGQLP